MGIKIRLADSSDLDWVTGQLKEFSAHYGTRKQLFGDDIEHSRAQILSMFANHPFFIAEKNGAPIGFISGYIQPHPYNPAIRLLSESFWWVIPSERQGRASLLLIETFIAWGKNNADWIAMFLEANTPVKDRTLTKRGFRVLERTFLMEVS